MAKKRGDAKKYAACKDTVLKSKRKGGYVRLKWPK